jgi:hypothetical protein
MQAEPNEAAQDLVAAQGAFDPLNRSTYHVVGGAGVILSQDYEFFRFRGIVRNVRSTGSRRLLEI